MFQAVSPPIIRSSKTVHTHTASRVCQACLLLPLAWVGSNSPTLAVAASKHDIYQMLCVQILGKWPTWRTILFYVFVFIFNPLHVSSTSCSSSGETNCVNTTSGNCHSVLVAAWCAGWEWTPNLHITRSPTQLIKKPTLPNQSNPNLHTTQPPTQVINRPSFPD